MQLFFSRPINLLWEKREGRKRIDKDGHVRIQHMQEKRALLFIKRRRGQFHDDHIHIDCTLTYSWQIFNICKNFLRSSDKLEYCLKTCNDLTICHFFGPPWNLIRSTLPWSASGVGGLILFLSSIVLLSFVFALFPPSSLLPLSFPGLKQWQARTNQPLRYSFLFFSSLGKGKGYRHLQYFQAREDLPINYVSL